MRRIADRYVLEEPLGSGGMGSIYRARHELIGQAVAIKLLKRALLDDPVLRERFHREAVSLAKLRHPGIVSVLDYGESDGDRYMVLDLVEGETLERLIEREGAMTTVSAAPIIDQVLAALAFCHENEIVHRDVKPSNVMLSSNGSEGGAPRVVLIDFGLARVGGSAVPKLTETGAVHGTAQYMSPEQCRGEEVGPPADVYSAGVLFYEMLSGAPPFRGTDAATLMAQHLFVEPVSLRVVAAHVSAGVSAAVHAALAKQPIDRPTARELRGALAAAARGADPEAQAEVAADLRRHVAGLARSERALGGREAPIPARDANADGPNRTPAPAPAVGASSHVLVWTNAMDRGAALRGCLATAGVSSSLSTAPSPDLAADIVAVIVSARDGMERVRNVRALAPKLPIVVVDVSGRDETTAAIRAGASDMVLREAPDADLVPKLTRLLRRRARA